MKNIKSNKTKNTFTAKPIGFKKRLIDELFSFYSIFFLFSIYLIYIVYNKQPIIWTIVDAIILFPISFYWIYASYQRALRYFTKIIIADKQILLSFFDKDNPLKEVKLSCDDIMKLDIYHSGPGNYYGHYVVIVTQQITYKIYATGSWKPKLLDKIFNSFQECRKRSN